MSDKLLFIFGTARSGTSALCTLLTRDSRICLGMERYSSISKTARFTPELFEERRFFDIQPGDTWYPALEEFADHYARLKPKYAHAEYRGDKIPFLVRRLDYLLKTFPSARFLISVRDIYAVAASYEARANVGTSWSNTRRTMAAVQDWNLMLENSLRHIRNPRIHWVLYEDFFSSPAGLEALYSFLGMSPEPEVSATMTEMFAEELKLQALRTTKSGEAERALIDRHARFDLFERLRDCVRQGTPNASPVRDFLVRARLWPARRI